MGYSQHAVKGAGWNSFLKILTALTTLGKIFILARLLSPSDFGLFSLVAIALGLIESSTETGINTTIIQSKKSVQYFLDTAWVIAILRGLVISILMIGVGWLMQIFYHEQQLFFLVSIASLIPLVKGFINPAIVSMRKNFHYFQDSAYQFSLLAVDALAAVIAGLLFHSVIAFILGMMTSAFFEVTISFVFFNDRPSFHYLPNRAQEIFSNMTGLNISALLSYAVQNVDNLLIGKILGISLLGIYANGYSLSHRINLEFAKSIQYGIFPVYVKITDDRNRLKRAFWKSTGVSLGVLALISLPLFLFPDFIVRTFLSAKWIAVAPILPPLIIAGMVQSAITLAYNVMIAKKKYFWVNWSLFINVVSLVGFLFWLGSRGLQFAVLAVILSRILAFTFAGIGIWKALYAKE